MQKNVLGAIILATMLAAGVASAGGANGVITSLIVHGTQYASVTITNPAGTAPACHNGAAGQFSLDIATTKGKGMLSALEGAQISGRTVGVGSGTTCLPVGGANVQTADIIEVK
jgi:hypothetical protein